MTELSEQEARTRFITPAIQQAGWLAKQIREEVHFTDGRIIVRKQMSMRGQRKRVDYLLYYQANLPIAIIEAKKDSLPVGAGMPQALDYGAALDVPFIYSSNGKGFVEHDRTVTDGVVERELALDQFPAPAALWERYRRWKALDAPAEEAVREEYFYEAQSKTPRYYQTIAINRTVEAIVKGQRRILLVMATGTGKTYTAFQIAWRLWRSKQARRILYLADRNVLIDQTMVNDFRFFGEKMTKVTRRTVDKSYEVYMALYQGLSGTEAWQDIYKQFSADFFDLIIVDECHRGSAAADSAWREILEYFADATQIGMTATPKETKDVSNIDYFGDPVYTYSLKQGIEDGFLAPYKVVRVHLNIDDEGWKPGAGLRDKTGKVLPDRVFTVTDFDKTIVIDERTHRVAERITQYLKATDRFHKTIVFCRDIEHAERMRMALVNCNADLAAQDPRYVMRITGDNEEGKRELDNFIAPDERYPVIATTSKLMTTGVDAQTCHLIVLDNIINSMTEFKQIIGRGTRIREEYGKRYFTIMDFRDATRLFKDKAFDGEPVQVEEFDADDPVVPREPTTLGEPGVDYDPGAPDVRKLPPGWAEGDDAVLRKYYVDNVEVAITSEQVQYRGADGKLVTETFEAFSRRNIVAAYGSLDGFLRKWNAAERKEAIVAELLEQGVLLDELAQAVGVDMDPFDLVCHVAFDQPPLTRRERAAGVTKRNYFGKYKDTARAVLEALLTQYAERGIDPIEEAADPKLSRHLLGYMPYREYGTPIEIARAFGGPQQFLAAVRELEDEIYRAA